MPPLSPAIFPTLEERQTTRNGQEPISGQESRQIESISQHGFGQNLGVRFPFGPFLGHDLGDILDQTHTGNRGRS